MAGGVCVLSAATFSHKQHLAMELSCEQCHTAARSSTRAADNLLPPAAACRACHDDGRIPRSAPARQFLTSYNHALHLKMSNVAPVIANAIQKGKYLAPVPAGLKDQLRTQSQCEACHRGLRQSDAIVKSNFPAMADCLVCHDQIDVPSSCTKCHLESQRLRPPSHNPEFIDLHSSSKAKLDKTGCAVCHGRNFTCQGCH